MCFQILSFILIAGLVIFLAVPKYSYHHPSGEYFIIKSNNFTGKSERIDFKDIPRSVVYDKRN